MLVILNYVLSILKKNHTAQYRYVRKTALGLLMLMLANVRYPMLLTIYFSGYTTQIRKSWDSMENANKKESSDF